MGLFSRRTAPADTNTTTAVGGSNGTTREKPVRHGLMSRHERRSTKNGTAYGDATTLNSRPGFGQWLKLTWPDLLTMVVMGAIGLGVYEAPPAPNRSFPVYYPQSSEVVYPQFAYPLRHEIIPIWAAALIASLVPIFVFLVMQIRIRSFWDLNNSIIGLLYSLICAAVFQVFVKWLIGGLRPHFLDVCKPDVGQPNDIQGNGWDGLMYTKKVCTGDQSEINDSLESMPSGHSTAAFAGLIFLYLYLNAKLKVFANYHPAMWKLIVTYMPVLGAVLIAGTLTIDEFHNWYDVVAGALIGTVFAFSAYRMVYASVWDFRFNHIPLTRHLPFTYGDGPTGFDGFHDTMWTRQAGWGTLEGGAWGGAPFDAASAPRGNGGIAAQGAGLPVAGAGAGAAGLSRSGHRRSSSVGARRSGEHGRRASNSVFRKPVGGDGMFSRGEHMV